MAISNRVKDFFKKISPSFLIDRYHFFFAFFSALFYGFPSKKMRVIGVTGTNGKTTTINLITKILEEAGYKVASLSSIKFKIRKNEWLNELRMTMPGRARLQKFLKRALNSGCQYVVLEVTSEGIKQHRHRFIDFDVAVFTNLSPEHIEAHGGFENYKRVKGELFKKTKNYHVINLDDENVEYFLGFEAKEKYGYKIRSRAKSPESNKRSPTSLVEAENSRVLPSGIRFSIENTDFDLKLLGRFNIYNALAAICVGFSQGVDLETCKKALEKAKRIPGRMEIVISEPFTVFVDYAFTPNALERVYQTILKGFVRKKLICVLGSCGGGRDKWKRPVLGALAAEYCNEIIITNEDPYDEDPMEIINQLASGAQEKAKKILDRREAIREALEIAARDDVVVITGKGSEPSICLAGGKKIPWDDREVVKEEFQKL